MPKQVIHRRRYPKRKNGTRKKGTYIAGSKKPKVLKRKPRVFVSFHTKDKYAKELLLAQSKNKNINLQLSDQSLSKPFSKKWKSKTEKRINKASTTVVMVGKKTHEREAVEWEIKKSREAGNKIIAVPIHKNKKHRIPKGIKKSEVTKWKIDKLAEKIRKRKKR
jgi:hypothetical protein